MESQVGQHGNVLRRQSLWRSLDDWCWCQDYNFNGLASHHLVDLRADRLTLTERSEHTLILTLRSSRTEQATIVRLSVFDNRAYVSVCGCYFCASTCRLCLPYIGILGSLLLYHTCGVARLDAHLVDGGLVTFDVLLKRMLTWRVAEGFEQRRLAVLLNQVSSRCVSLVRAERTLVR